MIRGFLRDSSSMTFGKWSNTHCKVQIGSKIHAAKNNDLDLEELPPSLHALRSTP